MKKKPLTRSEIMARIKCVSRVEINARKHATRHAKCRLMHQPKNMFGRPDYANKKAGVVVFIDGCFFHGCPEHFSPPKTNTEFWVKKIARNIERRKEVKSVLKKEGYTILEFWEHDLVRVHRRKKK